MRRDPFFRVAAPTTRLLPLIGLGMLLCASARCVWRTRQARRSARPEVLPEPLQTWEAEGGRPTAPQAPPPVGPQTR